MYVFIIVTIRNLKLKYPLIMNTFIISDLHLEHNTSQKTSLFVDFLIKFNHRIKSLYIVGDFFEYWIDDDVHIPKHQYLIETLDKFNYPIKRVFLMRGNRDFLLGDTFAKWTNCTYIEDPYIIKLNNIDTLLTHGDLFLNHKFYVLYRKIT